MKIVIAPDSFKECASADTVARAIADGVARVYPDAELCIVPIADGGEGTVNALIAATGGTRARYEVTGPDLDATYAKYGLLHDGSVAVIEMAAASGLALVPAIRREPMVATTRGTGELIGHVLDRGVNEIIIGIGGSATNDGGAGMAQALGYRLLDKNGRELPPGGAALIRLARIEAGDRHPRLDKCRIRVACDVDITLCGPRGASRMFGPQKGASPSQVKKLDAALCHFGRVIEEQLGVPVMELPGGGAAGGLGAGLVAFAGARLESGIELVAEACGLADKIRGAHLVITGEGKIDGQTASGKTPLGVARIAKAQGVPVVVLAGTVGDDCEPLYDLGIDAIFSICPRPAPLEQAIKNARKNLSSTAENVMRLFLSSKGRLK